MGALLSSPFFKISGVVASEDASSPQTWTLRTFGSALLVGASYYIGTRIGFAWTPAGQPNSTFWPPNAILLACFLLAPVRIWWALVLAVFPAHMLAQLQVGVPVWTAVGWFTTNISEALIGAFCITRLTDRRKIFDELYGVFTFIIFAVVVAPLATSFLDAFAVVITGWGRHYWPLGIERFFTNALAVLTIVPTITLFGLNGASWIRRMTLARCCEAVLLVAGTVLVSMAVFGFYPIFSAAATPALLYAPLALLLWATARFGTPGLSFSVLLIALISTWNVIQGREPFPNTSMAQNTLSLQILLCIVDVPLMFLSAVINDSRQTEASLRMVSGRLIAAQEQERARIGRDLHDDIAQRLALVAAEVQRFESETPETSPELRNRSTNLHEEIVQISHTVHTLSRELHASRITYVGLVATARSLCKEISERHNIEIDFKHDPFPDSVPSESSLCLFRVLQEALHNAVKHSGAQRVEVQLRQSQNEIHLTVSDTGRGFDPETAIKEAGLGLTSMQERLRLVNGKLSIVSEYQRGTTIHASVPFTSESNSSSMAG
jgi:signal transduction histidine kinase